MKPFFKPLVDVVARERQEEEMERNGKELFTGNKKTGPKPKQAHESPSGHIWVNVSENASQGFFKHQCSRCKMFEIDYRNHAKNGTIVPCKEGFTKWELMNLVSK